MPTLQKNLSKIEDYPAHLEKMWKRAKRKRADNAPTVISTFAGGGGSTTGYLMAGFRELLAVEWDDNAVETLRANYPEMEIYHGDIAKLSVGEILERTGLQVGELDILDGSPPCQGFSTAGKRNLDDDRNQLFREFVRILDGLQPKVFVMENVSGMVKGKMRLLFVEILQELKGCGYKVSVKLMNTKWFGVPQSRPRLIFIGVRDDLGVEPNHPLAESRPIVAYQGFRGIKNSNEELLESSLEGKAIYNLWFNVEPGKNHKKRFSLFKLHEYKTPSTISKTGGDGAASATHWDSPRYLTRKEIKRVGSFPDNYIFVGGIKNHYARIGNSVPPLFMEAIARHIRENILGVL